MCTEALSGKKKLRIQKFPDMCGRVLSQLLSSEKLGQPKSLDVALNVAGVEKYARKTCGCGQHWRPFDSSFE